MNQKKVGITIWISEKVNFRGKNKNLRGWFIMVKEAINQGDTNFKWWTSWQSFKLYKEKTYRPTERNR